MKFQLGKKRILELRPINERLMIGILTESKSSVQFLKTGSVFGFHAPAIERIIVDSVSNLKF